MMVNSSSGSGSVTLTSILSSSSSAIQGDLELSKGDCSTNRKELRGVLPTEGMVSSSCLKTED